jgi:dTDP-4-amino-4,6-dideoxygalactose transaminase
MSRDAFDRFTATVPSWYYEIVAPGFKYNLTDIAAAMGLHQLKKVRAFQRKRAAIAERFNAAFADLPLITAPTPPAGELHAWHLYALRLADGVAVSRDRFIERLYDRGVGCSVHYIPLHLHPYWRDRYALTSAMFPHSQHAFEQLLSLPIYTRMTDADVERVVDAVRASLHP